MFVLGRGEEKTWNKRETRTFEQQSRIKTAIKIDMGPITAEISEGFNIGKFQYHKEVFVGDYPRTFTESLRYIRSTPQKQHRAASVRIHITLGPTKSVNLGKIKNPWRKPRQ